MGQVDQNIAVNLKRIRKNRNLSLDMVSELTGVSKSMLGQIERGESNPTIGTISKIVEGIKISYEDLLYEEDEPVAVIDKRSLPVYRQKENAYAIKLLLPYDKQRAFEVYSYEIEPGAVCEPVPLEGRNSGLVTLLQGSLTVTVENKTYELEAGKAFRFQTGRECFYHNPGAEKAVFEMILANQSV